MSRSQFASIARAVFLSSPEEPHAIATGGFQVPHAGARIRSLDLLRGIAILMVLMQHYGHGIQLPAIEQHIEDFFQNFGWSGVDLFFVLSGYLIGGLLFREIVLNGHLKARRFLARRAFKIWPGYFALLAYAAFRYIRHGGSFHTLAVQYWPNLLQVQNYTVHNLEAQTWSLALEEHFYLLLPAALLILLIGGRDRVREMFRPLAWFCIGFIALFRTLHGIFFAFDWKSHIAPTHLRIDALLFGVLLAHLAAFSPGLWRQLLAKWYLFIVVALAILTRVSLIRKETLVCYTSEFTLLYLGFGCLLIGVAGMEAAKGMCGRFFHTIPVKVLASIGFFSYAIYLWHHDLAVDVVSFYLRDRLFRTLPLSVAWGTDTMIYLASAIAAGMIMTYLIERPALLVRDRFLGPSGPTKKSSAVPAQSSQLATAPQAAVLPGSTTLIGTTTTL